MIDEYLGSSPASQTRMNWWSPLDERRNVFTDILLSPVAFDLIVEITQSYEHINIKT